jgi:hypothetical protein
VQSIRRALARSYSIASATCCGSIWIVPSTFFWPKDCQRSYDHAERDRRRLPAARPAETPPFGNTGALPTGIVTGGPRIL